MTAKAIERIREEHRNMAKVLAALRDRVAGLGLGELTGERLDLLYRMLYYIRVFPNRSHHPKEEDYLFPAIAKRAPEMKEELAALGAEHEEGDLALQALERRFAALQKKRDPESLAAFKDEVARFVQSEFAHMRHEEDIILPAAERSLTQSDWSAIDKAFASNRDPVFNEEVAAGFEALRRSLLGRS